MALLIKTETSEVCFMVCVCCLQALAGPGIFDNLHHRPPWYAETACGIVALAAQFSPWDDLLFRRPGSWSPATKDHLPQEPHTGGTPLRQPIVCLTRACWQWSTETPLTSRTDCFLSPQCHIKINSAYGSMKDISVYNMLGLSPSQIFIVGRPSKKYQNQCQVLQFPFISSFTSFSLLFFLESFCFSSFTLILSLWLSDPSSVCFV